MPHQALEKRKRAMNDCKVTELRTFVPSRDYVTSTSFYEDLGFEVVWAEDEVKELRIEGFSFLLQNYNQKDWAENFMMQLKVTDLDAWWRHIVDARLVDRYAGVRAKEPQEYPWGLRQIHLIDPAGVLWHIVQDRVSSEHKFV